jgi:hypothetical protein
MDAFPLKTSETQGWIFDGHHNFFLQLTLRQGNWVQMSGEFKDEYL